ncbi:MAG: hypothetical protein Q4D61_09515, partial [Cardiobacteriaceae bacterium]|nr:hypothetical protein [Cardiobacteriaceae bacterium]
LRMPGSKPGALTTWRHPILEMLAVTCPARSCALYESARRWQVFFLCRAQGANIFSIIKGLQICFYKNIEDNGKRVYDLLGINPIAICAAIGPWHRIVSSNHCF